MNPAYDFKGQVAFVTGASSGMGLATALAFAEAGAAVTLVDRNAEKLEAATEALTRMEQDKSYAEANLAQQTANQAVGTTFGSPTALPPGVAPSGPSQSAQHSQAQIAAMLAFAHCVRGHGFPNFPDPTSSGAVTHQMVASAGINLHQPAVLQAGDACVSVTHGVITKAAVARFVAGQ